MCTSERPLGVAFEKSPGPPEKPCTSSTGVRPRSCVGAWSAPGGTVAHVSVRTFGASRAATGATHPTVASNTATTSDTTRPTRAR